jgi:adenylyltransferase/sulfurtransferase
MTAVWQRAGKIQEHFPMDQAVRGGNWSPTNEEAERYRRHLSLSGFGAEGQRRLRESSLLMIGAGGLGCPALVYLVAAGVGRIVVIDPDRVEESNLQRQTLYVTADAGEFKATTAARRLKALNPLVDIVPMIGRFGRDNALELVRECDVVIDGSDNFATRYLVNDACVLAGRPFVYGAVQGFSGQLSVFNWKGGPTYRCLFPEPPEPGTVPNCAEAGVLGVLPGLIGTAQACEAIKLLTGIGESLSGRLWLWDALSMTVQILNLQPDPRSRDIRELPREDHAAVCAAAANQQEEIDPAELQTWLAERRQVQFVDVRETGERAKGAIEPSLHLPWSAWREDGPPVTLDVSLPTVVYCAAGGRSLQAVRMLRIRHGFASVRSLRGGFEKWRRS